MARLDIGRDSVTVYLTTCEAIGAVHRSFSLPRSSVQQARAVPNGMAEVAGFRFPGTYLARVIALGSFRQRGSSTLAVCRRRRPAAVLELANAAYDRIVVTVDDPEAVVAELR